MQFLKEIEAHLENFESEVKDEIKKFIDHLYTKYQPVTDAVVPPPAPLITSTPVPAPVTLVPVCAPAANPAPVEVIAEPAPTTCAPTEIPADKS